MDWFELKDIDDINAGIVTAYELCEDDERNMENLQKNSWKSNENQKLLK